MDRDRELCTKATMCRLLDVSASGYYAWPERAPSARAVSDAELLEKIRAIHIASRGTYGAPRILHELRETHELHVSRKRVARLMREAGIQGVHRRKRAHTTIRDDDARPAPDLVDRNFEVDRPDRLWVADITYVPTWSSFLFLAVVLDAFSRRIVGWAMATHLRTSLVLSALDMALFQRQARRRHPSLGPGHAVHVTSVRPAMPGGRGATVDGFGRGLLRQCDVRELLRAARVRADRAPVVSLPR